MTIKGQAILFTACIASYEPAKTHTYPATLCVLTTGHRLFMSGPFPTRFLYELAIAAGLPVHDGMARENLLEIVMTFRMPIRFKWQVVKSAEGRAFADIRFASPK